LQRRHRVASTTTARKQHMPSPCWQPGQSGNPAGRTRGSRNALSEEVICALLRDFRQHGQKAVARVRQTQPAAYLQILASLAPREHKAAHRNLTREWPDDQFEAMIEFFETSRAARAGGPVKVIEATADPPEPKNRLMLEADPAVGPRERMPRKVRPPQS